MNKKSVCPSPVKCDYCRKGFHPGGVFKTKKGKNICIWCIRENCSKLISMNHNVNLNNYLNSFLSYEAYTRFLFTYGGLGDRELFF